MSHASTADELAAQVAARRTFAIISHPDAGKSTLTEKLLLYAGAIELAGAVRGARSRRHVVSDWMAMEQERGISLTSTALEFDLDGCHLTLLDTPGHKDFSEDTYRSLVAADSVVMVIDAAKGIESQTRKLYEVCRRHRLPVLTFVNKLDHPGRDPLELLDEIESVLGIAAAPMNWPVGRGDRFRGVYSLEDRTLLLYERHLQGQRRAPVEVTSWDDPRVEELVGEYAYREFHEGMELVMTAGATFDEEAYLDGRLTGVYFGSALHNFGHASGAGAAAAAGRRPAHRAGRRPLQRLRLQDSGEHGPAAPRPRGLRPRLFRTTAEGHGRDQRAHERYAAHLTPVPHVRPRPSDRHRSLRRRHRRHRQPRAGGDW
jgi:peptide chain release factor 3